MTTSGQTLRRRATACATALSMRRCHAPRPPAEGRTVDRQGRWRPAVPPLGSAAVWLLAAIAGAAAAAPSVQEIRSPGPALRMSGNGKVTGYYVAKCTTLSSQPKRTLCYNAPWLFDGKQLSKLANRFPSNANAMAVAVNDAGDLIGADLSGAWYLSGDAVAYVDGASPNTRGTRLLALNNAGVAVGMSSVNSVYQPVSYSFGGVAAAVLAPGYAVVDINDDGWIVGWFRNDANLDRGFVAAPGGSVVPIPSPDPAIGCRPVRISQTSPTGEIWVAGNCTGNRPFRYKIGDQTSQELGYAGSSNLSVVSINSRGDAAGTAVRPGAYAPDGYTALLWSADTDSPTDLNSNHEIGPPGAWNVHATDINDAGSVLTGYNDTSGNFYTFVVRVLP